MIQVEKRAVPTWPVEMGLLAEECGPCYPCRRASVLVIIPAYNEETNIAYVVRSIRRVTPFADVLVVNDGSLDATAEVARRSGAGVLNLPFNLGIGGAVQTGIKFAYNHGYPFVVRVDGDGQHDPVDIPRLLSAVMQGRVNVAIGSRFCLGGETYRLPFARALGICYFSTMVSLMVGYRVYDTTSGFQCMDRYAIRYFARYYPQDYPEVEAHILMKKAGLKVMEIPVKMRPRKTGISSIDHLRAIYYMLKVTLATWIAAFRAVPRIRSSYEELDYVSNLASIGTGSQLIAASDNPGAGS
jgi:glycosyltransferase involved in cell wall biosynthesis